jgi:transposase
VLEWANLKLTSVLTDIKGVSARAMLAGILAGEDDVALLADLAQGRMRAKRAALEQALTGRVRDHHRFLLAQHLMHLDFLEEQIAAYSAQIAATMEAQAADVSAPPPPSPPTTAATTPPAGNEAVPPHAPDWAHAVELLDTIPGVARATAELIIAEIGTDMQRFGSAARLASWAKVCPGNNESAGKRRSGRTGQGNAWLKSGLVLAAHAAVVVKDSYFAKVYRRLVPRRGAKRAIVAVAHRLLVAVYSMLLKHEPYRAPEPTAYDERRKHQLVHRMQQRIERLGYAVTIVPIPASAA